MRSNLLLPSTLLLAATAALTGCAAANSTSIPVVPLKATPLPAGTYTNWQFQTGLSLSAAAPVIASGPLQIASGSISGLLMTVAPCSETEARTYAGTLDASTGALTIATVPQGAGGSFVLNSALTSSTSGNFGGGAMGSGSGATCQVEAGGPGIAVEIPTLTGAYTGTLSSSSASGSAALTLTQTSTPDTDATFPLTATLQFTSGSCSASYTLSGSISGAAYTLASSGATISGLDSNNGQTLPAISVTIPSGSCASGTYTGTLTLQ